MKRLCIAAAAAMVAGAAPALAADPLGTWITEGGRANVRIANCGAQFCGTIISLKEPNDPATGQPKLDKANEDASKRSRPLIGVQIVLGMKAAGPDKWEGSVYNAEDGKTYRGIMTMTSGSSLTLQGCVLGGLICRNQTWTRAN